MITCKRCGKDNQDHYKFCLGCGSELSQPAPPAGDGGPPGSVGMMRTVMAAEGPGAAPTGASGPNRTSPTPPGGAPQPGYGQLPGVAPGYGGAYGAPPPGGPPPAAPPAGMAPPPGGPPPAAPAPGMAPVGPPPAQDPGLAPTAAVSGGAYGAPAAASGPRNCPSCGAQIPPNFKFCGACGTKIEDAPAPAAAPASAPVAAPQAGGSLTLIRPDGSEGGMHTLRPGKNPVGRDHGDVFESDGYLSPTHAEVEIAPQGAVVRDLDSLNGVFMRMTDEEEIQSGQILRIGQELVRFDLIEPPAPLDDGTEVMGSPNPGYWGKLTVILGADVEGSAYPLLGDSVTLGRERGDINFPDDGYVSGLHARVSIRGGRVFVGDLGSSNGTFVKIQGERAIENESFILLGQQLFRVELA